MHADRARKILALVSMACLGGRTLLSGGMPWIAEGILATLMLVGAVVVLHLPTVQLTARTSKSQRRPWSHYYHGFDFIAGAENSPER
jgi:hypothetical protein